jgi:hypothetical protein
VGVPGVLVPVDASEIVLEEVNIEELDGHNEEDIDDVTVYVTDPGVSVAELIFDEDTDAEPLVEFTGVSVGTSGIRAVTDGLEISETDTSGENDAEILSESDKEVFIVLDN